MGTVNTLPSNVAIGTATDSAGNTIVVMATPEFLRMQAAILERIGGVSSLDLNDIVAMFAGEPSEAAAVGALSHDVQQLALQVQANREPPARLAVLERRIEDLQRLIHSSGPMPVDWEHPGKIGASKANSGKFTTLDASGTATFKPAGAGTVTIQPATTGTIDNMTLGATTAKPANVTTLGTSGLATIAAGMKFTGPATLGNAAVSTISYEGPNTRFYVGDGTGYSFRFSQRAGGVTRDLITFDDNGSLTVLWKFGCNGKTPQAAAASGGTLAGVIAALVANGILSS